MASAFNLTAQINLRGPDNLKPIVSQIRRELGSINANVNVKLDPRGAKSVELVSNRLSAMNNILTQTKANVVSLNQALRDLSGSLSSVQATSNTSASGVAKAAKNIDGVAKSIKVARTEMEEFGKQSALAVRRFAAFSVVTSAVFGLTNAITSGFKAFITFDRELVKLQQVTGKGAIGIKSLENEITRLATTLGVSSESLMTVASTLAQAGLNANETRIALAALAKTELAPSFDNLTETTEGAIAALRQFGLQAQDLEAVLGSINAVAAAFAVESRDIITAIQRTGGVFASASKGVSQGKDALNEFIAVFTSVRATTRESAETIATGLRTIFTRIQRAGTIKQLKEFGVELQDLEGKFVGPFEAVKRLSEALLKLDPRDIRFATIVEELGGFRQIGKVIPLIQQFATTQQALGVAQRGQSSLTDAQIKAQQSLANQIAKVREQFLALIRDIGQSTVFQGLFKIVLGLTSGFLSLASAFKPILPILAVFTAIKGVSAIGQFATGFFGGLRKGGGAGGAGQNIGESLSGAKEKQRAEVTAKAADAIRSNTDALKTLTSAINNLTNSINRRGGTTLNDGGKVLGFNKGGMVPGNGGGDTVPAYLEGGEIVMNRRAVKKYGAGNLLRMNKYVDGGRVNITAQELKSRYRGSKALQNLITDDADLNEYMSGRAINTLDNISFNRRVYKLNEPNLVNDWSGFEEAVKVKTNGIRTNIGKNDPSFPIDITNSNYGPLEVRNRRESTSNRTLLDKLIRYYISKQEFSKLKNRPSPDDIKLGNIGVVYNSAKYDPPNAKELSIGGKIQKFMAGGAAESYYGQAEVEAAKAAQSEYQKSVEQALSFENLYFEVLEGKSIAEGIEPEVYGTGIGSLKKGEPGVIGARKVRLSGAIKNDSAVNVAALDAMVENLRKSAFKAREAQQQVYTDAEASISAFKTSGLLENIDPSILKYIEDTIGQLQAGTVDPEVWSEEGAAGIDLEDMKKKLTKPNLEAFANLMKGEQVKVQGQRTKLSEVFNTILETYGSNVSPVEQSNITSVVADKFIKSQEKDKLKKASFGGLIQKFVYGGATEPLSPEELVAWIQELGKPQDIRGLAGGTSYIDSVLKGVAVEGKPASTKEIFSKNFILGTRSGPYLTKIQDLLEIADKNKKRPRIFTEEEKANATKVGLVGMLPFGINDVSYEEIAGKILSIHTATLPKDKVPAVVQMRREIDEVLGRTTKALYGDPGQDLDDPTKEALGLGNLEGYMIEAILARAGANPGKLDDRSVDYSMGLGKAAGLFNIEPNIPTEIKRDVKSGLSKARSNFRNYFAKFAFGGKADGTGFEEVKKQIMDKYPEIDFRISKRKSGFGYMVQGGLSSGQRSQVNFASNLGDLSKVSDQMAQDILYNYGPKIDPSLLKKLQKKKQFAIGGLAEATGEMQGLMRGLYGNRSQPEEQTAKKEKNFGKIGLRNNGSEITATYFKNAEREGMVTAKKASGNLYTIGLSKATKGFGPKLYDVVMEAATSVGGMLTSDRSLVSDSARAVWAYYFNNRSDVKKTPLDPKDWTKNSSLLDPKLYGKKETWPPPNDPAWILQSGYSKSPNLINSPDIVNMNDPKYATYLQQQQLGFLSKNSGGIINKFASGGTVPAMVSSGEAYIPPGLAKKIGYGKLNKMNQADRNGMKGFSGGGISVFKGPGSGTSDSIGPIGLPTGSFIIREKATKALGLHKNGYSGGGYVRKFVDGGSIGSTLQEKRFVLESKQAERRKLETERTATADPAEKKRLTAEMKALQTEINKLGGEIKDIEDNFSSLNDDIDAFSADVQYAGKTLRESIAAEFEALTGKKPSEAKIEEILQEAIRRGGKARTDKGTITVDPGLLKTLENTQKNLASRQKEKQEKFGGIRSLDELTMPVEEFVSKKREQLSTEEQKRGELQAKASTATGGEKILLNDQIKQSSAKIDELNSIIDAAKQSYSIVSEEIDQAGKEEAAASDKLQSAQQALVDAIRKRAKDFDSLTDERKAAVIQEVASTGQVTDKSGKVQSFKAEADAVAAAESAVASAKSRKETAEDKKETLYPTEGVSVMPKINTKMAEEQRAYTAYKAEKAGMSVGGYKYDLASRVGKSAFDVRREAEFAKTETKNLAVGRARELKGVNINEALKADTQEGRRVQGIIDQFAANLQKVDPSLGAEQARDAAIKLAEGLSEGKQSVEEIIATNKELDATFKKTLSETEIMTEAFRRTGQEIGESAEFVKANVSQKAVQQQQFLSSKEGKSFGMLGQLAPGAAQALSKTRVGKGLIAGGQFVSGQGGALSKAFAGAGGFTGIGTGLAVGAESLKQLLPKTMTSDPNTAGALGALGGAGAGAAMGAQLGSFAGPIGTLIGGVGGAIIGGIQGFFSAKNQAVLTNALENMAKTTGDLDEAFKKLEADSSQVNFDKAQQAFGDVVNAGKDIEGLAFSKTGFQSLGDTFTGGIDKFNAGLKEGDISKTILGGLQTAFGASGGGLLVDYFSAPSEAQRTEAIGAMVGGAGQKQEAATRLAETQLKTKSADEIAVILDNIKNGTGELNPIVDQYVQGALKAAEAANGTRQLTAAQEEAITVQAKERAALDAYMKKRKESGATDEQIAKELSKDRGAAIKEGEAAIKVQAEVTAKQALLAKTMKEVTIVSENLADVYRRITAYAQKYSDELDRFSQDVDSMVAGLGGDIGMRTVDRKNEQVLGNVSAYSMEEVKAASAAAAGFMGGTPEAQNLANQAVGQKIVLDQIPNLLRNASTPEARAQALGQIEQLLKDQGIDGEGIKTVLKDLENKLTQEGGATASEVQEQVQKSFETIGKGAEALQTVIKKYNDTLQLARKYQQDYNKAILEAGSYMRKAGQVRLNAELDLAKALGRSPTLEELNKPFDVEVNALTSRLVGTGDLAAGAASDPMAIAAAITSAEKRKGEIERTNPDLFAAGAGIPAGPAGDPMREKLNQEQLANIQAVGELTVASNEGRQALEKLANDGSKAANALAKIQEEQQAMEGFGNFAQKVFTAEPQELARMELNAAALNAAEQGGPNFMKSRRNRQQAFAGLEQKREFMLPEEYRKERAQLIRQSFESQGKRGGDVVTTIGGKDITLDELTKRLEGGVDETDPNVIEFRKATEIQAKANEALGMLNVEQAMIIERAMLRLEAFLTTDFPNIIAKGNADAQEANKPPVIPEPKEKKPSTTEEELKRAKTERDARADEEKKAKADAAKAGGIGFGPGAGRAIEAQRAKNKAKAASEAKKAADVNVTNLEAKVKAEQEAAVKEEKAQQEQQAAAAEAAKVKQKEAEKAKSEETIERTKRTRESGRPVMVAGTGRLPPDVVAQRYGQAQAQAQQATAPQVSTQQAAAQSVDTFTQQLYGGLARTSEEELARMGSSKSSKEKEIAKKEKRLKYARVAAYGREGGPETSPNVQKAQAELDMAKADMENIKQQIAAEEQKLAAYKAKAEGKPTPAATDISGTNNARAQAFAGLEQQKNMMLPSEYNAQKAQLIKQGFESQGYKGTDTVAQIDGKDTTLDELIKRIGGGEDKNNEIANAALDKLSSEGIAATQALQSPLDLVAAMATAALQSGSIYTHDQTLAEQLGVLNETITAFTALPTGDPGFIVSDIKVLEALNNMQAPLAVLEQMAAAAIAEGINTKDVTLSQIAATITPAINMISTGIDTLLAPINAITGVLAPILDTIAGPIKGIASYFGVKLDDNQARGIAGGLATGGIPGAVRGYVAGSVIDAASQPQQNIPNIPNRTELAANNANGRIVSAPVPVTRPTQTTTTTQPRPEQTQNVEGSLLTLNPDSLEQLNTFNTNFASYVDKLVAFEFPKIPDKIEMTGNHTVDVRISGAAAFEGLKKDFEGMMQKEISKAMGKIWGQSNGQFGTRPPGEGKPNN